MAKITIEIDTESSDRSGGHLVGTGPLAIALIQGIGIVSSIPYDAAMTASFNAGLLPLVPTTTLPLSSGQVYIPQPQDNLTYQTLAIQTAIQDFDQDGNIGLIVTFGGIATWLVAAQYAKQTPFISLIGGILPNTLPPPSGKFLGAVTLDSYNSNKARITDLVKVKPKVKVSEIFLLNDPRSSMAPTESNAFGGGGASGASNGINDPATFSSDFDNIKKLGAKAVIISAAPYFYYNMEALIKAANGSKLYISYPLLDYANTTGVNQPTLATLLGPALSDTAGNANKVTSAYRLMGAMANTVLSGQALKPALQLASTPPAVHIG